MKIVRKKLIRDGPGSVKMLPEEADDLWIAYNLIEEGDSVLAVTTRKIARETSSRYRDSERVKLELEIEVETMEFDKRGSGLRIRGRNVMVNELVKVGAFHTLEIVLNRPFVLKKEVWDTLALDALNETSSDACACADLGIVLMQEGLANVFLVGKKATMARCRIQTPIPRKRGSPNSNASSYDMALCKFFDGVVQAFVRHIDFKVVRCAVIAGPGFTKDKFVSHLLLEAERKQRRQITENKSRILLVPTTSGYKHCLREILDSPDVMNRIRDTKGAAEVRVLKEFLSMMSSDPARACYGPKHVEIAHDERMAVQRLLITDELFESSDVATRRKYVNMVESVKDAGGTAHIFSSMHVSGVQLAQLTGIAAILRFPLPDLEDIDM